MIWLFMAIPIIGLIATLVLPNLRAFIEVDKCLDNGGSYNHEICECDFEQSHEYKENPLCK